MSTIALRIWFLETRPQFLLLSVVLAFLGNALAWHDGSFGIGAGILAGIGLVIAHISVNVLNDYFDYKSGIDLETRRTPFSGGSGILPTAQMRPGQVLWYGLAAFIAALGIGIYFMVDRSWLLLPVIIIAAICVLLYTPVILRTKWPEWSPGLGMGMLPVLGIYFVQTTDYALPAIIAAVPSGFMVHNLLLINEFPDIEADRRAGRKTTTITLGKRGAGILYSALDIAVYAWIIGWVAAGVMPVWALLSLLSLPFAVKAIQGALHPDDMAKLMPGLGNNVFFILFTNILLGIGYILDRAL